MIRSAILLPAFGSAARPVLHRVGVAIAAGALLAVLGPFGSYLNGGPIRLAGYWIGAMLLGLVFYGLAFWIVSRSVDRDSRRWWPVMVGATVLASVPEALATRMGAFWLWPDMARLGLALPLWFAQTATIGLLSMVAASFLLGRRAAAAPVSPAPEALDKPLGGDVLALQMEDHYVRVHRPTGSELILMPLARAVECVSTEGLRTHRSWWVAAHAVAAVEGNARSMRLHLSNGLVAPVARSALTHLKAAGWIADAERRANLRGAA